MGSHVFTAFASGLAMANLLDLLTFFVLTLIVAALAAKGRK